VLFDLVFEGGGGERKSYLGVFWGRGFERKQGSPVDED
jgi:hypothetical protein